MNSDMMIAKIPNPRDATATQDEDSGVVDVAVESAETLLGAVLGPRSCVVVIALPFKQCGPRRTRWIRLEHRNAAPGVPVAGVLSGPPLMPPRRLPPGGGVRWGRQWW